jgi:hypothetical protein
MTRHENIGWLPKYIRHSGRTHGVGEIRNLLRKTTADSGFIADEAGDAPE